MAKRKRGDESHVSQTTSNEHDRIRQLQIDSAVFQSRKALLRSLKLAKGFERQKLSRRRKTAQDTNDGELSRIDEEIEAWKVSDVHKSRSARTDTLLLISSIEQ